jgi:hypothetical protein
MIFFAIYIVLIKFLNYDCFSLYAAARNSITTTKPTCQRTMLAAAVFLFEMIVIVFVSVSLLALQMFKDLALPGAQLWMCPWPDETVTYIGMVLLYTLIIVTAFSVMLC